MRPCSLLKQLLQTQCCVSTQKIRIPEQQFLMSIITPDTVARRAREKDHRHSISSKERTVSLELQKLVKRRHECRIHLDYVFGAF